MFQSQNVLFDKHHLGLELAHGIILYQYWRFRLQKRHMILNTCDLLSYLSAGRLELVKTVLGLVGRSVKTNC